MDRTYQPFWNLYLWWGRDAIILYTNKMLSVCQALFEHFPYINSVNTSQHLSKIRTIVIPHSMRKLRFREVK
jgi:hypothetical protein